jgi:hypothetical protein
VYLDEEGARRKADDLVAAAREHLAAGRDGEARTAAHHALAAMPSHSLAHRLLEGLPPAQASRPGPAGEAASPPAARPAPPPEPRAAEAAVLSAVALQHFLKDDHDQARAAVDRALALDPSNRRALDLQKILRVLG